MSLLPALWRLLGETKHLSINWDATGRCQTAICEDCGREIGVSTAGRLLRHGPVNEAPCRGAGGETTVPMIGPKNSEAAMKARNVAMAGRRRPRGKR